MSRLAPIKSGALPVGSLNTIFVGVAVIALAAFTATANARFVSADNIVNILVQTSYLAIFTLAQSIPLLTRGFDLSLGATVSSVSLTTALFVSLAVPYGPLPGIAAGVGAGLLCGLAIGAANGALIGFAGLNPFIVTLGTWNIILGVVAILSGGFARPIDVSFSAFLSQLTILGLPISVVAAGVVFAAAWWILEKTVFGRQVYLMGANPRATAFAGFGNRSITFKAYMLCGAIGALGAVLLTARTGSGEPNLGGAVTLQSIAAAVIGGVSLRGGEGRFYSPILGALLITVLSSALNFLRVESYLQMAVLGAVIIVSVCIDQFRRY